MGYYCCLASGNQTSDWNGLDICPLIDEFRREIRKKKNLHLREFSTQSPRFMTPVRSTQKKRKNTMFITLLSSFPL